MKARSQQSLVDLSIQEYGGLAGLVDIALRNGKSITDLLTVGEELTTGEVANKEVVNYFKSRGVNIAVGSDYFAGFSLGFSIGFNA